MGGGQVNDYVIDYYPKTKEEYNSENSDGKHNWWRLYKSGWLEQGGHIQNTTAYNNTNGLVITMLKPFKDMYYSINKHFPYWSDNGGAGAYRSCYQLDNQSFKTWSFANHMGIQTWEAKGWSLDAFK